MTVNRTPFVEPPDGDTRVIRITVGKSSWPAAEKAGLVSAGGMWMTSASLEKVRALKRQEREERRQREEGSDAP